MSSASEAVLYLSAETHQNIKCLLVAQSCNIVLTHASGNDAKDAPLLPALRHQKSLIFGANNICAYLAIKSSSISSLPHSFDSLLLAEEHTLHRCIKVGTMQYAAWSMQYVVCSVTIPHKYSLFLPF
jgi:hypothetical protein